VRIHLNSVMLSTKLSHKIFMVTQYISGIIYKIKRRQNVLFYLKIQLMNLYIFLNMKKRIMKKMED